MEPGEQVAERIGIGGEANVVKDSTPGDPSFSLSFFGDWAIGASDDGDGVTAPWLERESLCRMVWLIKKRHRPTGEDWGTESTELLGVLICNWSVDPVCECI